MRVRHIFILFTTWNIIFIILYPILKNYIDILLTSLVTLIVSAYFVIIKGNQFSIEIGDENNYNVNTIYVQAVHLVLHIIPFIVILILERNYKLDYMRMIFTILLLYIYMLMVNVEKLYMITREEMVLLVMLAIVIIHW